MIRSKHRIAIEIDLEDSSYAEVETLSLSQRIGAIDDPRINPLQSLDPPREVEFRSGILSGLDGMGMLGGLGIGSIVDGIFRLALVNPPLDP